MYCINCGVKLSDTEERCPLCGTVPYHPEIPRVPARPLYPRETIPETVKPRAANVIVLILFLVPALVLLIVDMQVNHRLNWFGYVAGALSVVYVMLALPAWFQKPNPVVFVPCSFGAILLYLLYINLATGGHWFMSFAFPVAGLFGLVVTAVTVLLRYLRRGRLFIFGGALMLLGGHTVLIELLLTVTFDRSFTGWSAYPLIALLALGGVLIYLGANRSAREMMERKLFI